MALFGGIRYLDKLATNILGVGPIQSAVRESGRPIEMGTSGSYSISATSGTMTAGLAANSEIFNFRWTHLHDKCLIRSVTISAGNLATAFAAGFGSFMLRLGRTWTATGTGQTTVTIGSTNDKRTDFQSSNGPSMMISGTGAISAGAKVLDTNDFAQCTFGVIAVAGQTLGSPVNTLWSRNTADEWPIMFSTNEGFVIRATVPATGTWTFGVSVEWTEVDPIELPGWFTR